MKACASAFGAACIDDPSGGACPPFTCREHGLGFGAWLGWRPAIDDTHAINDRRGELARFNPAAKNPDGWTWEHRDFAAIVRTRCRSRVTRNTREKRRAFRRAALQRLCAPRTIGGSYAADGDPRLRHDRGRESSSTLAHVVLRSDPILTV